MGVPNETYMPGREITNNFVSIVTSTSWLLGFLSVGFNITAQNSSLMTV